MIDFLHLLYIFLGVFNTSQHLWLCWIIWLWLDNSQKHKFETKYEQYV